jgi:2-phospho-L-lactate transferase/gluconeogenesis factor (CofD/UPF0052 family)
MTQPGETDLLLRASDQVRVVTEHAGGKVFDYVLVNRAVPHASVLGRYTAVGARIVEADVEEVGRMGFIPIGGELVSSDVYARHDPDRLANAVLRLRPVEEPVI